MKAGSIQEVRQYLENVDTKYQSIIFADHGAAWRGAGQVLSNSDGFAFYREEDILDPKNIEDFQNLKRYVKVGGSIVLLGCFTAAPQLKGTEYLKTFSLLVDREVIGNQGESWPNSSTAFTWKPIGGPPKSVAPGTGPPRYQAMATDNAGKWSRATPDGQIDTNIGNVGLDEKGVPRTTPFIPTNPESKQLPSWQEYLAW